MQNTVKPLSELTSRQRFHTLKKHITPKYRPFLRYCNTYLLDKEGNIRWFAMFDSKEEVLDHYTILDIDGDYHGCSDMPFHHQGFGQYCGDLPKGTTSFRHLGRKLKQADVEALPEDVKQFIIQRTRWQKGWEFQND